MERAFEAHASSQAAVIGREIELEQLEGFIDSVETFPGLEYADLVVGDPRWTA
jgi:hypothetical protein